VSPGNQLILASDLVSAVPRTGVDPTLDGRALRDALRRAIATRRGSCSWTVDHARWVVTLYSLDEQDFCGRTLEKGLAWSLVWLMALEVGHRASSGLIVSATTARTDRRSAGYQGDCLRSSKSNEC
jgi:hypothetical protein